MALEAHDRTLFSNRSGALAALGRYAEALADADQLADQTIALDPTWAKGYSRKGAALSIRKEATSGLCEHHRYKANLLQRRRSARPSYFVNGYFEKRRFRRTADSPWSHSFSRFHTFASISRMPARYIEWALYGEVGGERCTFLPPMWPTAV